MSQVQIIDLLHKYRIKADMAWSEVKDGFYTQEEYDEAIKLLDDNFADLIYLATHSGFPLDPRPLVDRANEAYNPNAKDFREGYSFALNLLSAGTVQTRPSKEKKNVK